MSNTYIPGDVLVGMILRESPDEYIRRPLWEFPPAERKAVLSERTRRFGAPAADREFDPEYH